MDKMLVGFAGNKGHGKDTAALALKPYGFEVVKFADPLKNMGRAFLASAGMDQIEIERCIEGDRKEEPLDVLSGASMRRFMQLIGYEFGRGMISDSIWADIFRLRVNMFLRIVCTDVRFPNEVEVIRSLGGRVFLVKDPRKLTTDTHVTESSVASLAVDGVIVNGGDIQLLHSKVLTAVFQGMV